jgi:predicted house-cleaning noncanonical NTP pyrophosphatase (MazG superfamily)
VSEKGIGKIPAADISVDRVGWKAFGLSCIPSAWVPPFFVVESAVVESCAGDPDCSAALATSFAKSDVKSQCVLIRSSGASETIEQRGRLVSEICDHTEILGTIRSLSKKLPGEKNENVHWIVQEYIQPTRKGHLSNERRLSHEPRDFVAEFELKEDLVGYATHVAVRHWRDGVRIADSDLSCTSEAGVTLKLKRVALWAARLKSRILFEWVWDGTRVWIVQADLAESRLGVNPNKLRPTELARILPNSLHMFRVAVASDFDKYRKLRNARTYQELDYEMPVFYVLDDLATIRKIVEGNVSDLLALDLEELTRRPLMVRTDGVDIPKDKLEMLPRSEDLHTSAQGKKWLMEQFSMEVQKLRIADLPLCLIAHHFIPSIAAAWARAEETNNIVRVESLWGLPEGLYWHSHDTFEVDSANDHPTRKRLRFKGTFVAPDDKGLWVHYRTAAPFDWGRSIAKEEWLLEIAKTTKLIAEHDKHAVSVMWFVDNDPRATHHKVLPWYHIPSEIGSPIAAPRKKLTMVSDFNIQTTEHWQQLKASVKSGKKIERIMLEPKDPELVRNQEFARELAEFAAEHKIVIELAGGVLSHAYHILQRHGAHVECIDLFGAKEETMEYNKLVRDKIPSVIQRKGEGISVLRLKGEALLTVLRQKLIEESFETLDAKPGELIGELADVQEVIKGICNVLQVPTEQLDAEQAEKRESRGGFERGIMLRKTSTPHSLAPELSKPRLALDNQQGSALIEYASEIPAIRPYRRPDLRNVDTQPEALLTFETALNRIGTATQSAEFEIPIDANQTRRFRLSIELTREHSILWSQVRLRLEPVDVINLGSEAQMQLMFPKQPESE